ncbi:MAG: darcynin [Acaryochloridaceae cyanobacterium CSU_3_4]|nr:darcynin [Acaryochloridaceae cyanobacterium CSU_3_4]
MKIYTIFMLVKTTNEWLSLSPDKRFAFLDSDIRPILNAYPEVKMRFFDTEGFNSRVTDVIIWETQDLERYQTVVEKLRESKFWDTYFEVTEILLGIENAYASHYEVKPY